MSEEEKTNGGKAAEQSGSVLDKFKDSVVSAIDQNGNGEIDVEDLIIAGLKIPGIRICREEFLRAEFKKRYSEEVIDDAVIYNPAHAKIALEDIDEIAQSVITFERACVSGISTALGIPGGWAMAATIPADIAQYYGYMLRAAQKLMYLYGFPQIIPGGGEQMFDSETLNILTLCLGVMYGVAGANNALHAVARALANGVEKKLLRAALTKGTVYPVVKNVAKWFGIRMTKQLFANFFKKAIPVVGGVVGGVITYASFGPCCHRLQDSLKDTLLSNPDDHIVTDEEKSLDIESTIVESDE